MPLSAVETADMPVFDNQSDRFVGNGRLPYSTAWICYLALAIGRWFLMEVLIEKTFSYIILFDRESTEMIRLSATDQSCGFFRFGIYGCLAVCRRDKHNAKINHDIEPNWPLILAKQA
jgi:hypothetical protein